MTELPKFLRGVAYNNDPRVIVFKGKHGNWIFDATGLLLFDVSLYVLSHRKETNFYSFMKHEIDWCRGDIEQIEKELEVLGDLTKEQSAYFDGHVEELTEKKKSLSKTAVALETWLMQMDKAILENDGVKAYLLLQERDIHEYEGFSVCPLDQIPEHQPKSFTPRR